MNTLALLHTAMLTASASAMANVAESAVAEAGDPLEFDGDTFPAAHSAVTPYLQLQASVQTDSEQCW